MPLPVAALADAIGGHEPRGLVAQRGANLIGRPDVELALFSLAVGVVAAIEAAPLVAHLAPHEVERLLDHAPVERLARHLPGVEIDAGQQGVVIEHLLEVGHEPALVGRIAGEAAAKLVIEAAVGHRLQRALGHVERHAVAAPGVDAQQELQRHRRRELGGAAEAAQARIETAQQAVERLVDQVVVQRPAAAERLGQGRLPQVIGDLTRAALHVAAPLLPRLGQGQQHLAEGGQAVARRGRVVGAAEEGAAVGCQGHGHRPAALPGQGDDGAHVDAVQVGPLFAIDLDVDEVAVHQVGRLRVLERLMGHDVAPVAGGITDGQQDGLVRLAGGAQGLFAPRIPVHRVFGMLPQVGAGFLSKSIGHGVSLPQRE